jgi:hypothetical protein
MGVILGLCRYGVQTPNLLYRFMVRESRDSSVVWMIAGSIPCSSWEFFSSPPRPDRFWGPPSLLSDGYQGLFLLGVKWPGRESDHSPPSSAEVKNTWSCTSCLPYAFVTCCFKYRIRLLCVVLSKAQGQFCKLYVT